MIEWGAFSFFPFPRHARDEQKWQMMQMLEKAETKCRRLDYCTNRWHPASGIRGIAVLDHELEAVQDVLCSLSLSAGNSVPTETPCLKWVRLDPLYAESCLHFYVAAEMGPMLYPGVRARISSCRPTSNQDLFPRQD